MKIRIPIDDLYEQLFDVNYKGNDQNNKADEIEKLLLSNLKRSDIPRYSIQSVISLPEDCVKEIFGQKYLTKVKQGENLFLDKVFRFNMG